MQFLNTVYDTPREWLPWYNTLVWTVLVTPVGFLVMACAGFWSALRSWRSEPIGPLLVVHWVFLLVLRALPHTPGHDGVRLFLPAFGVLSLLAGRGARWMVDRWGRWGTPIAASVIEGMVSIAIMMPMPLSYYSPLVGGLPGATALGMEPAYYWDSLTPGALRWLTKHTPPGQTIQFAAMPQSVYYLPRSARYPDAWPPSILANRNGSCFRTVRRVERYRAWLVATGHPQYTVSKLGVPLLWVFPYSELEDLAR